MVVTKKSWMFMAMLLPGVAFGQFFNGTGVDSPNSNKPWTDFKLNPKTRIKLDFRDASVDNILAMYEKASGITIVKDPALIGKMSVTSAKPVSLNDAYAILKANLDLKGYDLNKDGSFLVIKNRNNGGGFGGRGGGGFDPTAFGGGDDSLTRIGVHVYPCLFANAAQLAKVVNDVYSGQGTTTQFGGGGNPFGGGGNRGNPFGGGNNRFGGGGGGQFGNRGGFGGMFGQPAAQTPVKASSDDYTNSVIVTANDRDQTQVGVLVKQLDKDSDEPMKPHVFKLLYASCNDVLPVLTNVLQTDAPRGKAGAGPQSLQGTFQTAIRIGTGQAASGPVVADIRTNSLVVTTTPTNLAIASKLVEELDQPVKFESTTFVYPLQNARADMVANLFSQAFGQRAGTTNTSANRNQFSGANASSNTTATTGGNNAGGANRPAGTVVGPGDDQVAQSLPLQMQDPNATSGDLLTSIGVTQGFGFGGGGQRPGGGGGGSSSSSQSSATVTQVRDPNGQIVNQRDLTGTVTVIPDPNTGNLIVVTTPDNQDLVKSILAQLDKVPQQVMIQTVIVEASLTKANQFGLEWQYATTKNGATSTAKTTFGLQNASPPLTGFSYTLAGSDLTAFFNMLQTDTKFQVLSTPRIFTSNNTQASINISQSIPYIVSTIENTNGTTSFNYAFQDVGIVLTVTPRITSNGYVNMDVTQTANDLQGYTSFNAPIVNQREANTTVSVKDGETIVLGGIIQNQVQATVNKVPLLGDIPILGALFQSKSRTDTKTELLVFLTPKVILDPAEAKKLYEETKKEMSSDTKESLSVIQPKSGTTTQKTSGGH